MKRFDLTRFRSDPERLARDAKQPGCFAQVEIWLVPILCRSINRNLVVGAQRRHPLTGPSVAISGDEPVSVESTCDKIVIGNQHELAYGGDDIGCGAIALTLAPERQAKLSMDAAHPVDHENDLG